MEESKLYNLVESAFLRKWKQEIKETEKDTEFFIKAEDTFIELKGKLNDQQSEFLKLYSIALEDKLDYLYYNLMVRILNLGIKIGQELGITFAEYLD